MRIGEVPFILTLKVFERPCISFIQSKITKSMYVLCHVSLIAIALSFQIIVQWLTSCSELQGIVMLR